jgi:predicted short-subunit dehydrogenase-like oxidoreductase (DUF2520 family)
MGENAVYKNTNLRKMSKRVSIAIIGKGKVGSSIAMKVTEMKPGYKLFAHLSARKKSFGELAKNDGPEVIFICSKDSEIVRVAKKALKSSGKNLKLLVHCAGSRESTILPTRSTSVTHALQVARLTLHPIQTFAEADAKLLKNIYYMASSDDAYAKKWAKRFVKDIGGIGMIEVRGKDLPLYHALVVFASNFTMLIGGVIEILSKSLRIPPAKMKRAIAPLMQKSLGNVLQNDASKILTGPLARKDYSTILKHRIALRSQPAALRKIYEGFVMLAEEII